MVLNMKKDQLFSTAIYNYWQLLYLKKKIRIEDSIVNEAKIYVFIILFFNSRFYISRYVRINFLKSELIAEI